MRSRREDDPYGPGGDGRVKVRQDSSECEHMALGLKTCAECRRNRDDRN